MRRNGNRSAEKLILLRQGCGATRKLKSRVRNATKENARQVQHDARFIGVSEQPEPVAD